jgi:dolichyl-phosphate-mannose-protein mannosyltransferase
MSRTALLDGILMFWVLAGFGCLLIDRDRTRGLLADRMDALDGVAGKWGPSLGWRPWRWAAGLMFGLACATKWNGLWYLLAFLVMTLLWDVGARRIAGVRRPYLAVLRKDVVPAFVMLFVLAFAVYMVSWTGWFVTSGGYDRQWAASNPSQHFAWVPPALRSLWHYHAEMLHFNVTVNSPHPYQSNPLGWLLLARPVAFAYDSYKQGQNGCTSSDCSAAVTALGNPFIWWAGILAIGYGMWRWIARRDWRSGAILLGIAAGLLPWIHYAARTIFQFYTIVLVPFLVLAVAAALGAILGDENADPDRRAKGASIVGAYIALTVAAAAFFYPVWTGAVISHIDWSHRMWLPSWI